MPDATCRHPPRAASPVQTAGGVKNCSGTEEGCFPTWGRPRSARTPARWEQDLLRVRTAIKSAARMHRF